MPQFWHKRYRLWTQHLIEHVDLLHVEETGDFIQTKLTVKFSYVFYPLRKYFILSRHLEQNIKHVRSQLMIIRLRALIINSVE